MTGHLHTIYHANEGLETDRPLDRLKIELPPSHAILLPPPVHGYNGHRGHGVRGRFNGVSGGGFIAERSFRPNDRIRVNERIRAREVRVIDEEGGQLGVMQPFEAMKLARERGLDLVEISPTADPPVCKITDYGKYLYQESKKKHEARKHHKTTQLKEVKFRPSTAEHDYQVRKNQIVRFLGEGHKVKAMIFHRGREMAHQEVSRKKMDRLMKEVGDYAMIELGPRMEANILMALLAPKKGMPAPPPNPSAPQKQRGEQASQEGTGG